MKPTASLVVLLGILKSSIAGADVPDWKVIRDYLGTRKVDEKGLEPPGFVLVAKAKGDLNGDHLDDLVAILHQEPPKPPGDAGSDDEPEYDLPQTVVVLLGDKAGGYTLWKLGANHFIESSPQLMEADGLGGLTIEKGVLTLSAASGVSAGSWWAGTCTQKWRNGPAGFQLIGLTVTELDRKCDCGTTRDSNLVTGRTIVTCDKNEETEKKMKKPKVTRTQGSIPVLLWEQFNYEKDCSMPVADSDQ